LIAGLAERIPDLTIVSGLAYGIDVAAHRAALEFGVKTVAVVANALPGVTPAPHNQVAREILNNGGAIVTEIHSQAKQKGEFYLARNRIIAALSMGTIVVESPASGGSLATADIADRVKRIMAHDGVNEAKAKEIAQKGDKKRKAYHDYYANSGWGEADTYDLCINSSRLGIEGSVEIIHRFIESRK
jgi:DNA processing protein